METKEDLQKLTLPVLRDKLKGRNLPITGNKSDLVDRLYESFQEEENLLSGSGANDDLDVDALLGTTLDEHSLTSKEEELLLGTHQKTGKSAETPKATPQKPAPKSETPVVEKSTPKPIISAPEKLTPEITTPSTEKVTPKSATDTDKHPISLNSNSKLMERAKRFGLPIQASDDSSNGASKPKIPRVLGAVGDEAKQKRLLRFGAADDTKQKRQQRFNTK